MLFTTKLTKDTKNLTLEYVGWGEFANPNIGGSCICICWGSFLTPTYVLVVSYITKKQFLSTDERKKRK